MSEHPTEPHGHSHTLVGRFDDAVPRGAARFVVVTLALGAIAVLIGLVMLWPSRSVGHIPLLDQAGQTGRTVAAHVVDQNVGACASPSAGRPFTGDPQPAPPNSYQCDRSIVQFDSGDREGQRTLLEISSGPGQPDLGVGDKIRVLAQTGADGTTFYSFEDFERGFPLAALVALFAVVVVAVGRWRGLRALVGIVVAFGVLIVFTLPALLDGKPGVPVALVTGALILYAVLYLAHGLSLRTSAALLGTLIAMVLAAGVSALAIVATQLTGLSEEANTNVQTYLGQISLRGLLLAGFIIGSLGVLNDVTITQSSSTFELAALGNHGTRRSIYAAAMRVGRDHIASTVYTLVLAYAGGALPLLLMFSVAGRPFADVVTSDAVAIEVARSAVGGIALTLAVPLTTLVAVMLARPWGTKAEAPVLPDPGGQPPTGGRHAKR